MLLTHGAVEDRPHFLNRIIGRIDFGENIVARLRPEVRLRDESLTIIHADHPSRRETIANANAIIEAELKDTSAVKRRVLIRNCRQQ